MEDEIVELPEFMEYTPLAYQVGKYDAVIAATYRFWKFCEFVTINRD